MKYDIATPYTASYVLLRKGDTIAFVLRSHTDWMNNYYGLPSGKVEKDESYTGAAVREALEEVGVVIKPTNLRHALTMQRREKPDLKTVWVDLYFEVTTWEGEPFNAEPDKHSALEWLDINNLPKNVIPSVRFALQTIAAGQPYAEFGW